MKKKASFVFVYWWVLLLFVCGLGLAVFAEKDERISDSENRTMSGFPEVSFNSIFSGDFSAGFESYLSDGVFGRDAIVGLSENMIRVFARNTDEDMLLLNELEMADEIQGVYEDDTTSPEDSSQPEDATDEGQAESSNQPQDTAAPEDGAGDEEAEPSVEDAPVSSEISGYGFWLELTSGEYVNLVTVPENLMERTANNLNLFKACLPEDGNVFYTNVPRTNTALLLQQNKEKYSGWYENTDEGIKKYTDDGVYYLNAPELLESDVIAGGHLYFESDHHWTPRGAVNVVNECMRLQGLPVVEYDDYEYKVNTFRNDFKGTADDLDLLYPLQEVNGFHMHNGRRSSESQLIYYDKVTYYAYLNGDTRGWVQYDTGFSTGRNALVIGDSYSNTFVPYLMPYYDEVNKVDIRHYNPSEMGPLSQLIKNSEVDDVFIVVTHRNGVAEFNSYDRLEYLLNG